MTGRVTRNGLCAAFFCQAEGGIRDLTVTGVQTCALPIYSASWTSLMNCSRLPGWNVDGPLITFDAATRSSFIDDSTRASIAAAIVGIGTARSRSEERRVGKECRSRWSPYY